MFFIIIFFILQFFLYINERTKNTWIKKPRNIYINTYNRFNTYIILIFSDLKRAEIYKMPYRNSPHQEIEKVMSFDYLHVFGPDENNKDGNFLFKIGDKK